MRYTLTASALLLVAQPALGIGQPAEAVVLAYSDIKTLAPDDARDTFYFWLTGSTARSRWRDWVSCSGGMNSLSFSRKIAALPIVMKDGTTRLFTQMGQEEWVDAVLMRANIRHYRQTREQFDKLGNPTLEPYFHVWLYDKESGKYRRAFAPWVVEPLNIKAEDRPRYLEALVGLVRLTGNSPCPIVEARNFVWQTAIDFDRDAGYYSWLGIKDQKSFEKLVRLDRDLQPYREAVSASGVAQQARAVERFGRGDGTWFTYDQVNQRGIDNRNPLVQIDRRKFKFDAVEVIGPLDNGMRAFGLFNNKGESQQSAPDGIGYNHQSPSNDGKIHVGYMVCAACHDKVAGNGLLHPFQPYFRSLYAEPGPVGFASEYKGKEKEDLDEQYLTPLDPYSDNDKRQYAAALEQATGVTPDVFAKCVSETFRSFDLDLDIEDAANEYGVPEEQLVVGLKLRLRDTGILDNVNSNWVVPKERRSKIGRDQFTESYNYGQLALRGIKTWPPELKAKLRPYAEVKK